MFTIEKPNLHPNGLLNLGRSYTYTPHRGIFKPVDTPYGDVILIVDGKLTYAVEVSEYTLSPEEEALKFIASYDEASYPLHKFMRHLLFGRSIERRSRGECNSGLIYMRKYPDDTLEYRFQVEGHFGFFTPVKKR